MTDDITREPLARAVLATLARTRGPNDPLGSLARTVLGGEADLRTAVSMSWHGAALDAAFTEALAQRDTLSPEQRGEFERQAQQLRGIDDQELLDVEDQSDGSTGTRESQE
ncbi:hypothetical protein GKC29_18470 [Micromonospora sp. WMMC415]|uniref:hypothetical protein n=1 Tax=Micromonospora sp. WMMC415 TaxID=2675222 RepID=UPI0012B45EE6|nr:hypothetical protein [Micromonospora sp. WMMC415]QGN48615.1 hypothetical protein GKC29_18470 [Micromonospora sp. WMMC415]